MEKFVWVVECENIIGKREVVATSLEEPVAIALANRKMDHLSTQDKHYVNSIWIKEPNCHVWKEKYRLTKVSVTKHILSESI